MLSAMDDLFEEITNFKPKTGNDNIQGKPSQSIKEREAIEKRFKQAYQACYMEGFDPSLVLQLSFEALIDHIYRGPTSDPDCRSSEVFETYLQVQSLSGDLTILDQVLLDRYSKAIEND